MAFWTYDRRCPSPTGCLIEGQKAPGWDSQRAKRIPHGVLFAPGDGNLYILCYLYYTYIYTYMCICVYIYMRIYIHMCSDSMISDISFF